MSLHAPIPIRYSGLTDALAIIIASRTPVERSAMLRTLAMLLANGYWPNEPDSYTSIFEALRDACNEPDANAGGIALGLLKQYDTLATG